MPSINFRNSRLSCTHLCVACWLSCLPVAAVIHADNDCLAERADCPLLCRRYPCLCCSPLTTTATATKKWYVRGCCCVCVLLLQLVPLAHSLTISLSLFLLLLVCLLLLQQHVAQTKCTSVAHAPKNHNFHYNFTIMYVCRVCVCASVSQFG